MTFHAYPIEWWQFGIATVAMLVHAAGVWDAWMTYRLLRVSPLRHQQFLCILAWGGVRTAFLRLVQQGGIFIIGIIGVLSPPPPLVYIMEHTTSHADMIARNVSILRWTLIMVSVVSIVKEVWAMYDRHRSFRSWQSSNVGMMERRAQPRDDAP